MSTAVCTGYPATSTLSRHTVKTNCDSRRSLIRESLRLNILPPITQPSSTNSTTNRHRSTSLATKVLPRENLQQNHEAVKQPHRFCNVSCETDFVPLIPQHQRVESPLRIDKHISLTSSAKRTPSAIGSRSARYHETATDNNTTDDRSRRRNPSETRVHRHVEQQKTTYFPRQERGESKAHKGTEKHPPNSFSRHVLQPAKQTVPPLPNMKSTEIIRESAAPSADVSTSAIMEDSAYEKKILVAINSPQSDNYSTKDKPQKHNLEKYEYDRRRRNTIDDPLSPIAFKYTSKSPERYVFRQYYENEMQESAHSTVPQFNASVNFDDNCTNTNSANSERITLVKSTDCDNDRQLESHNDSLKIPLKYDEELKCYYNPYNGKYYTIKLIEENQTSGRSRYQKNAEVSFPN